MMIESINLQHFFFCSMACSFHRNIFKAGHAEERNELMMNSKLLIKQVDRKKVGAAGIAAQSLERAAKFSLKLF